MLLLRVLYKSIETSNNYYSILDIEATQEMVSQLRQTVEKQCNVEGI